MSDLKLALRQLTKSPVFTVVGVVTLALGIGATTAIFTVVDTVLWRPLPFAHPEQLVQFRTVMEDGREFGGSWPLASLEAWQEQTQLFAQVEGYQNRSAVLTGRGEPRSVNMLAVTPGLFQLLGRAPGVGRPFQPSDSEPGNERVAIVSHAFWQQELGGQSLTEETMVIINDLPHAVIGAMPAGFAFPRSAHDMWVPLPRTAVDTASPARVDLVARLRPGLDPAAADRDLAPFAARMIEAGYMPRGGEGIRVHALDEIRANPAPRRAMLVFMGAVVFVLLIACTNVANLLLVRGAGRSRELAVRVALGATRAHIVRQLLTESLLLSIGGAAGGLLITIWSVKAIWALAPSELTFLTVNEVTVNSRVLLLTAGVTLLTTLFCGMTPAWRACRRQFNTPSSSASHAPTTGRRQNRMQHSLVIAEVALSLVLLIGAGLMLRSFSILSQVPPGFDPENVAVMQLNLPPERYPTPVHQEDFYTQLEQRLAALPGVVAVAKASGIPPKGAGFYIAPAVEIDGREVQPLDQTTLLPYNSVDDGYFQTMRIPILRGRSFGREDQRAGSPAAVISATMARRLWGNDDPIGHRFRLSERMPWMTVVGVAGDVRAFGLRDDHGDMEFYTATAQEERPPRARSVIIRTEGDPGPLMTAFKEQLQALDDKLPISRLETAETALAESMAETRFYATLVIVFAGVSIVLTAIGLYGVMTYSVVQRTRELGIRLALGAQRRDVLALVLKRGLMLALAGVAVGMGAAAGLTRFLESLLFGVPPHDPSTFAAVALGLVGVSLLACHLPARRATRINPVEALRAD